MAFTSSSVILNPSLFLKKGILSAPNPKMWNNSCKTDSEKYSNSKPVPEKFVVNQSRFNFKYPTKALSLIHEHACPYTLNYSFSGLPFKST